MSKMIFVNLPVRDLAKSMAFYEALGFTNEPRFTDETAAAMVWSDSIFVMLLTHEKWKSFTDRPIPPTSASEVSLALAMEDREAVDAMIAAAAAHGGTADINPVQDHGFMYGRDLLDPDGHVWGPFWMDPAVANGEAAVQAAGA
ncbi:lactoylglutathione lyase [Sphingopyxis terrae subsp. terrae NBRC 15098]|uniref:Lactoylglutathione lyase n=1 Tax=Sphingopyxis terrae subsp. terrae NBRC 15098 TaxID=1219058 RepID=A0A142VYJ3_9SPHN|nr:MULTISPECIES: VOC family protein [Sphingopyxis]AMU94345.1 lactoylglutathione lyase [Sphingopyxis terrae subsp. terrae NBRC 15098]